MVADLDLVDHLHPVDHAAEERVLAVEERRRREADVELAAARFALRVAVVARAGHRDRAAKMMLRFADLGRNLVTRSAGAVTRGVAALHDEARLDAMEREVVVEAVLRELLEVGDGLGRDRLVEFDHNHAAVSIDSRVMSSIAHGKPVHCGCVRPAMACHEHEDEKRCGDNRRSKQFFVHSPWIRFKSYFNYSTVAPRASASLTRRVAGWRMRPSLDCREPASRIQYVDQKTTDAIITS